MKRWLLRISAPATTTRAATTVDYELVPGERTVFGRSALDADCPYRDASVSRRAAAFQWRKGAFNVADLGNENGVFIRGQRARRALVDEGEPITMGFVAATLTPFHAAPLDDVIESNGYVLYGRRRFTLQGRWPAFRRRGGVLERAIVCAYPPNLLRPGDDDDAERWRDGDVELVAYPAVDGVPLALFAEAVQASPPDALAFGTFVVAKTGHVPQLEASDLLVTWDGALARLPPRRPYNLHGDEVSTVVPHVFTGHIDPEDSYGFPPEHLAELVRALFPDEHRAAAELREEIEALDDDGVRWLLERAQRKPQR